tara:strand:- start:726 stop:1685 length:960 start_codon:yes stop_codon:yes gene_type:complete
MINTLQYNYNDIQNKITNIYKLPENVENIINELNDQLNVHDDGMDHIPLKRSERSFDRGNRKYKRSKGISRGSSLNDVNMDDWEAIRNFKPTEKKESIGIEKHINDIRSFLNKISKTNYEEQKTIITDKITEIFKEDNEENNKKIGDVIFSTCCSSKFLSETYADLYVELVGYDDLFGDILDNYIHSFKESLNSILYVDPDINYDGFCDYNKLNEIRRSNSAFLINLMERDMISKNSVIELVIYIQNLLKEYIDMDNKLHEVNELTENLFILVSMCKKILSDNDEWKNIVLVNISNFVKLKHKEHISLSSRAIFKHMDM